MLKKYIEKYLDKTFDKTLEEGAKTLKRARLALLLVGIGAVVFFVGILGIIIYFILRFL